MTTAKRTRPAKYRTADDLINNCLIQDLCFVWPYGEESADHPPAPVLSPKSPLCMQLGTNSVARILFMLCRFVPASKRIVKWCKTPSCVNPYHHSETTKMVRLRYDLARKEGKEGRFFTDLIPSQERISHLLPSPELLKELQPIELAILKLLQESAMQAGHDATGLPASLRQQKIIPNAHNTPAVFGDPHFKPVLKMTRYTPPKPDLTTEERAQIDADMEELWDGTIFRQIEERKKRLLQKAVQDWDLPSK